ncbi:UTP--glucose-1-phosphate uridylyltransferase GalU [Halobacillus yeomjeoni]|uniref:UTP--glucose-1-phosphate uridylyltransferase n=1 Tax=Halobacillus yeomjeoni TaxID=311194 RepID=A0A931HW50_9BACI|nr:UTP--glucose-1-phosphate uridylyltransferase GalU [Halobacillus yeomjeoni]MBH0230897.1 UTP--glucose-1-phosphate uridylyltransferase GalU [Halobacillus yeomjeoni]MCA0984661.1 UTP--glucose-1-phosphate uridylyltransferase GalU [Halobacillus yeomjeoni]
MKVKKAIIPAAGLGTRFLPATKAMPKEMLPIVDKPTIQYIVEEAIKSGIEDIIIVTGKGKRAIEDHFDHALELEDNLYKKGKFDLLEEVQQTAKVDIHYIRQKEPKGLGHAIHCARKFIGDEPFAVLLGDDIVRSDEPCLKQLMNQYEETHSSVIGVKQVPKEETYRYGVIAPKEQQGRRYEVEHFVEKPAVEDAPSNLAIIGRYVFTPEIMELLGTQEVGAGGEIQLTDAIERLNVEQPVYGYEFEGDRYDVGNHLGFIETTLAVAMEREDLRDDVLELMEEVLQKQNALKS